MNFNFSYFCERFEPRNQFNPRTYKRGMLNPPPPPTPYKVFLSFFLDDKTSAPDVFSSCSFIPFAHFKLSLVMLSNYGYEV